MAGPLGLLQVLLRSAEGAAYLSPGHRPGLLRAFRRYADYVGHALNSLLAEQVGRHPAGAVGRGERAVGVEGAARDRVVEVVAGVPQRILPAGAVAVALPVSTAADATGRHHAPAARPAVHVRV